MTRNRIVDSTSRGYILEKPSKKSASSIFESYRFENWTDWEDSVKWAAKDFKKLYNKSPNVILVNPHTKSQIEFLVSIMPGNRGNLFRIDENTGEKFYPTHNEQIVLEAYQTPKSKLKFFNDADEEDMCFRLAYIPDLRS